MFLISWNVAGWSTTSRAIRESFGSIHDFFACTGADIICIQECKGTLAKLNASPVEMGGSDPPLGRRPVVAPLERLATVRDSDRSAGSVAGGASGGGCNDGIDGWESFWSFSGKQHRGLNGVVTFARKGLTWRCDSRPFAEEQFNEEGRVVVTHHSAFVLVNVYVPNARGGTRQNFKFRFLDALERKMDQLREETGKPVILAGDLNMTYRAHDAAWSLRRVHLGALLQLQALAESEGDAAWTAARPHLSKSALQRVSNVITNHLCLRVTEMAASMDMGAATAASPSLPISLSTTSSSAGTGVVSVDTEVNTDDNNVDREALQRLCALLSQRGNGGNGRNEHNFGTPPVPLQALYDAGFRCVYASDFVKNFSFTQKNELYAVVHFCGLAPHSDASAEFMGRLLQISVPVSSSVVQELPVAVTAKSMVPREEMSHVRMWDTFLLKKEMTDAYGTAPADSLTIEEMLLREVSHQQLYPYCPCPYTCWDQSRNRRLDNEGTRLDYILIDSCLLPAVVCRAETANNVIAGVPWRESSDSGALPLSALRDNFLSEVHGALYRDGTLRAMANGSYPPAPFDGTGMPPLADRARELCFEGLPSTGLFVTPPQFSDHIGVGLLLNLEAISTSSRLLKRPGKVVEDHKCMYRPPLGLQTFFAAAAVKRTPAAVAPPSATREEVAEAEGVCKTSTRVGGCKRSSDSFVSYPFSDAGKSAKTEQKMTNSCHDDSTVVPPGDSGPYIVDVEEL